VIEVCDAEGQLWVPASVCLTACDAGACTLCRPGDVVCSGNRVVFCRAAGDGWDVQEECAGGCRGGLCAGGGEVACPPGECRCVGPDVQTCPPDGSAWITVQSCMTRCEAGACVGPACLPFEVEVLPGVLPPDGVSGALVTSGVVTDVQGTPVPDASLFTVSAEGGEVAAADGYPDLEGIQVRTVNGRLDFVVRAPAEAGQVTVRAEHPVATRCAGLAVLPVEAGAEASVALDFTTDDVADADETSAYWDLTLARLDPFPSDFGTGADGALEIVGSYNINAHSQPWRVFPDGVSFSVVALDAASATVSSDVGGVLPGDEVLLINLQGSPDDLASVGNWETLQAQYSAVAGCTTGSCATTSSSDRPRSPKARSPPGRPPGSPRCRRRSSCTPCQFLPSRVAYGT